MHKVFIIIVFIIAMFTGASNEAKREIIAMSRAKKLSELSFKDLGELKANGKTTS